MRERDRKKILLVFPSLNGGGGERVTLFVLRNLDRNQFNIAAYVVSKSDELESLLPNDIEIILPKIVRNRWKERLNLFNHLVNNHYDIVFTSDLNIAIQLGLLKLFPRKINLVVRISGNPKSEKAFGYFTSYRLIIQGLALRSADKVICQNNYLRRDSIEFFRLKEAKVVVWQNKIDATLINDSIKTPVNPFESRGKIIVSAGRLHESKGFDFLIKSFALLLDDSDIEADLYILGSDRGAEGDLRALVERLDLSDKVHFEGFKVNPYVYYANCDLFVLPSLYEAYPNVLLENLYLHTPIVTTNCAEIIQDIIKPERGIIINKREVAVMRDGLLAGLKMTRTQMSKTHTNFNDDLNKLFL